jgi:hypothetical protein
MPLCRVCRDRIDISQMGVRARRCRDCGATVCPGHFEAATGLCHQCAGIPVRDRGRSFVRKPEAG